MLLDAAVVVELDGTISHVYDMNDDGAEETIADLMSRGVEVTDFRGKLIVPGFVDGHAHAPQVQYTDLNPRYAHREVVVSYAFSPRRELHEAPLVMPGTKC